MAVARSGHRRGGMLPAVCRALRSRHAAGRHWCARGPERKAAEGTNAAHSRAATSDAIAPTRCTPVPEDRTSSARV